MAKEDDLTADIVLTLRLKGAEAMRYRRMLELGRSRSIYADKSSIIRELFGAKKPV